MYHASNVKYLDQNIAMLLIIWNNIFGAFKKEEDGEPVKYGLSKSVKNRSSWNMIVHEWRNL